MVDGSYARPDWPALLSPEEAARYLSMDERSFLAFVQTYDIRPLDLPVELVRWRRTDLDRLLRRIPSRAKLATDPAAWDEKVIERAVERAVSREIAALRHHASPAAVVERETYGIREAATMLGMGRSTLYNLITDGRLGVTKVGRRTLIRRSEILRLLGEPN